MIVPGPGAYDGSKRPQSASAPSWGFGKDARGKGNPNATPGPGQYKIPVKIIDVPEYIIRG